MIIRVYYTPPPPQKKKKKNPILIIKAPIPPKNLNIEERSPIPFWGRLRLPFWLWGLYSLGFLVVRVCVCVCARVCVCVCPKPLSPESQTLNPKSQTLNPKP